ncbi:MAG: drug/metabolite transporter (DMT)-like permease [Arcobacteraceae bacterium]|jgi:drug/metabolite transporter (DMT)-like permease
MMKTYLLLTLCVLFWSSNFVLGRFIKDDITPMEIAFFRWFFVLVIVSPILITRFSNIYKSLKENFLLFLILSTLGITTYNTILYIALTTTSSTNALMINSTVPLLILLLSIIILKQKIVLHQFIGIILSTCGVIFLILKGDLINIFSLNFNQGDLLIIVSSLSWAFYSIFIKFRPKELNNFEFFATLVFLGFLILLPIYLYQGYTLKHEIMILESNYLVFMYTSIFASCLSYYFWHYGIDNIGAAKTGQFIHLMPVFGTILAYTFLNETLEYYHIVGAILIALGIYISLFYKRKISRSLS